MNGLAQNGVPAADNGAGGRENQANTTITAAEVAEIVRMYQSGATIREIAQSLGRGRSAVSRQIKNAGVQIRPVGGGVTESEVAEMVRQYRAGMGIKAVATQLGRSPEAVRIHLMKTGEYSARGHVTESELAEIVRQYRAGATIAEIAKALGRRRSAVSRHLKNAGVQIKPKGGITESEVAEIVRQYRAGATIAEIGKALGRGRSAVSRHLKNAGVQIKPKGGVTASEVAEMVRQYRAGATIAEIARSLGRSRTAVSHHLKNAGVQIRPEGGVTADEVAEMVRQYRVGMDIKGIATQLGRSSETVRMHLMKAGEHSARADLTTDAVEEMVRLYQSGATIAEIARSLGRSRSAVSRHLKNAGVQIRPEGDVTAGEVAEMVRQYRAGSTIAEISRSLGRSRSAVSRHLGKAGARELLLPTVGPAEVAEMVSLNRAGMSIEEISTKLGWSGRTVRTHLTNVGAYSPRSGPAEAEIAEMVRLWKAGVPVPKIAASLGRSCPTVTKYLKEAGGHSPTWRTTESEIVEMVRQWKAGVPVSRISTSLGRDPATVRKHLGAAGIYDPRRPRPVRDDIDVSEVVERFASGERAVEIASSMECSAAHIYSLLKAQGVTIRASVCGRSMNEEQLAAAKSLYARGASLETIGREFGCTAVTVGNSLKSAGVKIRPSASSRSRRSKYLSNEILSRHRSGKMVPEIARELGISVKTVQDCLQPLGEITRIETLVTAEVIEQNHLAEVVSRYRTGESAAAIGRDLGCGSKTVLAALRKAGVEIRRPGFRTKVTSETAAQAAARSLAGEPTRSIAADLGVGETTVARHIAALGVGRDTSHRRRRAPSRPSRLATLPETTGIVARYQAGESAAEIASNLGCSRNAVIRRLRAAGVQVRPGGSGSVIGGPVGVAVIRRYLDGESSAAIARSTGHSQNAVLRHLRRSGIGIRSNTGRSVISDGQASDVIERYQGGESAKSIARSIGRSPNTVLRLLRTRGVLIDR